MKRIALSLILFLAVGALTSAIAEVSTPRPIQEQSDAISQLRTKAERGDAEAQANLAARYANGVGVEMDMALAAEWYRKAAEQGNAVAQVNLGALYAAGRGVPRDDVQAFNWYRNAADLGNALGQYNLGVFYALGRGVPQDHGRAVALYRKAAEHGHQEAKSELARMEQAGIIGPTALPSAPNRSAAAPMTNADVVALCKSGLSEDVVVNAIGMAKATAFDVSTAALLELAKVGVPSRAISGMQRATTTEAAPAPPSPRRTVGPTTLESKYGKNAKYTIEVQPGGFVVHVSYSRYQFIPESNVVAAECKSAVTSIGWEYAEKQGRQIEPINEQRISVSMGRNGLKGTTTCDASAPARWK